MEMEGDVDVCWVDLSSKADQSGGSGHGSPLRVIGYLVPYGEQEQKQTQEVTEMPGRCVS